MTVTKDVIEAASRQLVFDPAGTDGGNVFTTWSGVITEALKYPGIKRIAVYGPVTVSSGNFGAGLSDIDLIGIPPAGDSEVVFVLDGTANCTEMFRSIENIEFSIQTATNEFFTLSNGFLSDWRNVTATTDGSQPFVTLSGGGAVYGVLNMYGGGGFYGNVVPIVSLASGVLGPEMEVNAYDANFFNAEAFQTQGGISGSKVTLNCYGNSSMDTNAPQTLITGRFDYQAYGSGGNQTAFAVGSTTYYKPNIDIEVGSGTALTLTLDLTNVVSQPGNYFRIVHPNQTNAGDITVTLLGGDQFFGGNSNRRIHEYEGCTYIEYSVDGWVMRGPKGIEYSSDQQPLHISHRADLSGVGFQTVYTRLCPTSNQTVSVIAYITARESTSGDKAFYRLEGVVESNGVGLDLGPANGLLTVIHEEDVNMSAQLANPSGTQLAIQVEHAGGNQTEWFIDATFFTDNTQNP